jgi:stage IV sporulation protein FB
MEEYNFYPQKPELVEKETKGKASVTIFSIVLFVLAFVFIFSENINFVFYLLLVIFIHEMGHFYFMKLFNYKNVTLLFVPLFGAFVKGKKERYRQKQRIYVIMAGPLPGVIIGIMLLFMGDHYEAMWMIELALLFLFINMINLLPLDPLDGGQLFKILLNTNQELFQLIFSLISSLLLIGLGLYLQSWVMVLFGFIMGFRVRSIQKNYHMHQEMNAENINFKTTYKLLSNKDFSLIKEIVLDNTPALRKYMDQFSTDETDPIVANQVNNVLVAPMKQDAHFLFRLVTILLWLGAILIPIYCLFMLKLSWFFDAL